MVMDIVFPCWLISGHRKDGDLNMVEMCSSFSVQLFPGQTTCKKHVT